ncbi:MAG: Smr/MutS family protein [Betaproteobacteria bacterium]|nr:Smr/MutS family protein [Betaproteobacteria bacterium]MBI3936056.1 Smr/MutS family protein [Betaproteobacteria bacterium]
MKKRTGKPPVRDIELFQEAMVGVTPLAAHDRVVPARVRPAPVPHQRMRDEQEVLRESLGPRSAWEAGLETGEELLYLRPGLATQTLRELRRGHWVIQEVLDLHGLTVIQARSLLVEFLNECVRRRLRCVRVVHGKGLRSKNREPVLKNKVAQWLMRRDEVLAFCEAPRTEGGAGAVVVLLKAGSRIEDRG